MVMLHTCKYATFLGPNIDMLRYNCCCVRGGKAALCLTGKVSEMWNQMFHCIHFCPYLWELCFARWFEETCSHQCWASVALVLLELTWMLQCIHCIWKGMNFSITEEVVANLLSEMARKSLWTTFYKASPYLMQSSTVVVNMWWWELWWELCLELCWDWTDHAVYVW